MNVSFLLESVQLFFLDKGIFLLLSLAIVISGVVISRVLVSLLLQLAQKAHWSDTLQEFLIPLARWGILLLAGLLATGVILTQVAGMSVVWFTSAALTGVRAVLTFGVGYAAIGLVIRILRRLLASSRLDATLHPFLCSAARALLLLLLGIACIDILGISTASVVAAMASVGLALSLSVKDHLSNLIGGVVVLLSKPFSKGDYIEMDGFDGVVEEIGLIYTTLRTFDARRVSIPNNDAAKAKIVNHSASSARRLDLFFHIGYEDDFKAACAIIRTSAIDTGLLLPDREIVVRMNAHAESSIEIVCRLWTSYQSLYELKFQMVERVKSAFDEAGISIPYHQLDLHVISHGFPITDDQKMQNI